MGLYEMAKDAVNIARKFDDKELIQAIVDLQNEALRLTAELHQASDAIRTHKGTISDLESKLAFKSRLQHHRNFYVTVDESGQPTGEFYCTGCWDGEQLGIRLHSVHGQYHCPRCGTKLPDPDPAVAAASAFEVIKSRPSARHLGRRD